MSVQINLVHRFLKVLSPTLAQGLGATFLSIVVLAITQRPSTTLFTGSSQGPVLEAAVTQLHDKVQAVLTSQVASSTALIAFWAVVGLVAYLVCWMGYNFMIEARNEVTLETQYTNRGHWRGAYETLVLKALSALAVCAGLVLLQPSVEFWSSMAEPVLAGLSVMTLASAIVAVAGLAIHFYLIFVAIILTFSPWYRPEAFTDTPE